MTQEQLAGAVGVEQTTISDIERGKNRNPSWRVVAGIARALGRNPFEVFPTDDLVGEATDSPNSEDKPDRRRGFDRRAATESAS